MNKNSKFKIAITTVLAAALLASCSDMRKTPAGYRAKIETETTVETTIEEEIKEEYPQFKYKVYKPQVSEAEGRTRPVTFYRDGNPFYGKITVPEGEGPFKTIIISSGLYARLGRYSGKASDYSDMGYAVIEFECQNGAPPPSYDDPEWLGDFIYEQVLDLYAVMDSMRFFPEVDLSNIYLYGHSMGGMVTSFAGTMRQDEVKGLILVDPSFYAAQFMDFEYEQTITTEIYPLITKCNIPVVIITGTAGSFGEDPHCFDEAVEAFPDCEVVVIEGANHRMDGDASYKVVSRSVSVMKKWDERAGN